MKSPAADFAAEAKPLFQSSGSCLMCHVESFHEIIPTFGIRTSLEKSQIMDIHFNLSNNTLMMRQDTVLLTIPTII